MRLIFTVLLSAFSWPLLNSTANAQSSSKPLNLHLMLSVDWEGDTLREANLSAMKEFNLLFPQYPVIHFLNAAYYTKNWNLSEAEITRLIHSVIKPNDELGIHIHAWENFVRASGVTFRQGPSFWNSPISIGRQGEYGDDVPLNTYDSEEIRKMLRYSRQKLESQGFHNLISFRGGGWMAGPKVNEALRKENFSIDSSAVPLAFVENLYSDTLLAKINADQWKHIDQYSQPHRQGKSLIQFPNNAGLADYVNELELFKIYREIIDKARKSGLTEAYLHFGWHQESAVEYFEHTDQGERLTQAHFLQRVVKGIRLIEEHARKNNILIQPSNFQTYPKKSILPASSSIRRSCHQLWNFL